jgi:uncharacterized protein
VRAVLDANVLVSALISRRGAPGRTVAAWLAGGFELVVCDALLLEVERTLRRPKISSRVPRADAERFLQLLRDLAEVVPDPDEPPPLRSPDPGDDYLLALAARERVPLVSGDTHLLGLADRLPVLSPRDFVERLERN